MEIGTFMVALFDQSLHVSCLLFKTDHHELATVGDGFGCGRENGRREHRRHNAPENYLAAAGFSGSLRGAPPASTAPASWSSVAWITMISSISAFVG